MTNKTRSLLHDMAEHMEYMQTCLKECHHLDEWDDYHWFRRSEELLARAAEVWGAEPRAARRPKPPSLKEQALETLAEMREGFLPDLADLSLLRRALEQLND